MGRLIAEVGINGGIDPPFVLSNKHTVDVRIRSTEHRKSGDNTSYPYPSFTHLDDDEIVQFDVTIYAEGMEVIPIFRKTMIYRARDGIGEVSFSVIPKEIGTKLIRVEFYHKNHWLTKIGTLVKVVEQVKIEDVEQVGDSCIAPFVE